MKTKNQFSELLQKFINKSEVTVMVQGLLEQILNEEKLNLWFEVNRKRQYTGELLFSTVLGLLLESALRIYRDTENLSVFM